MFIYPIQRAVCNCLLCVCCLLCVFLCVLCVVYVCVSVFMFCVYSFGCLVFVLKGFALQWYRNKVLLILLPYLFLHLIRWTQVYFVHHGTLRCIQVYHFD